MVFVLNVWRQIENPTRQSMRIYVENIPAKCHPTVIWNDGTLGFFEDCRPKEDEEEQEQDE